MQIEQGRTAAVVTGAASGLGRETAYALAAAGARVAVFDINAEAGRAVADDIGGLFCRVDVLDEQSAVGGFLEAREAHGQERILVHCAMAAKGGKTVGRDRETGGWKRLSTEDYEFAAKGILVASYRMASLSALGMIEHRLVLGGGHFNADGGEISGGVPIEIALVADPEDAIDILGDIDPLFRSCKMPVQRQIVEDGGNEV